MSPSFLLVIPLYNHGALIRDVLDGVLGAVGRDLPVLVVDDGSTDRGGEAVADWAAGRAYSGLCLVRHEVNKGKGAALVFAAGWARQHGYTHMIAMDADGQHSAHDIPPLIETARRFPDGIIVGSRDFHTENVPFSSRFGRWFSGFWMRVQTGQRVADMQSGFRVYPVSLIDGLNCRETGYAFEIEVLVRASWAGVRIHDTPISVYYPPAAQRVSHFCKWRDNLRISLLNTRLTIRALLPVPFEQLAMDDGGGISALHPFRALRMLLARDGAPSVLALSTFIAVLIAFLPLFGFQCVLTLLAVSRFKLNRTWALAVYHATWPPLLVPFSMEAGHWLRTGGLLTDLSWNTLVGQAGMRAWEWVLGAAVLGPAAAALCGLAVYLVAVKIRHSLLDKGEEDAA